MSSDLIESFMFPFVPSLLLSSALERGDIVVIA